MTARLAALGAVMLLVAGCSSPAGAPTVRPTLHLASMPAPVPVDTALPYDASGAPGDSFGPVGSGAVPIPLPPSPSGAFPDPAEHQLLAYLTAAVRKTCARAGPFYPGELASVSCGDGVKIPFVYYTLFARQEDMAAGYAADLAAGIQKPDAAGSCTSGRYEDQYTIRARVSGRVWCGIGNSGGSAYKLIEWTRDSLFVIGLINSHELSWDVLEAFWRTGAGPYG